MLQTLCCTSPTCLKSSCSLCERWFGFTLTHQIKLAYFFFLGLFIVASVTLQYGIKNPSDWILTQTGCSDTYKTYQNECVFTQITIRIFVSLSVLFVMCAIGMSCRNQKAKVINEGLWLGKIMVFFAVFGIFMLLGPNIMSYAYTLCLQSWLLYCCIQTLSIIDLLYSLTLSLKQKIEQTGLLKYKSLQILIFLFFYTTAIWWNVTCYNLLPRWLSITNSTAIALFFLAALVRINPSNTLLMSAPTLTYIQALSYIAGRVVVNQNVPRFSFSSSLFLLMMFLLALTLLSMLHRGSGKIKTSTSSVNDLLQLTTQRSQEVGYISTNNWVKFHLVMAVVSMAMPVVLTQFDRSREEESGGDWGWGWLGRVYAIGAVFFAYVIYLWSILCVRCYPDRDMSELESYFKEFELN